jgi:ferredoxin
MVSSFSLLFGLVAMVAQVTCFYRAFPTRGAVGITNVHDSTSTATNSRVAAVPTHMRHTSLWLAKKDWSPPTPERSPAEIENGVAYNVELPKKGTGISWGSDLSFRFIYVLDMESSGEAYQSGLIEKGDYIIGVGNTSTIAMDFDFVLTTLNKQEDARLNYTFFRGSKEQLMGGPMPLPSETTVTVTVKQDGKPDVILQCPGGTNLRQLLVGNGVNVYRSLTRWTNCEGKQRCGTCIVDIKEGLESCTRRSLDEEATLRENPESYRLSCITSIYGDVTVQVQGPVGAAQWTR